MATATATITIDAYPGGIDQSQRVMYVLGTIAISASPNTYATNGIPLLFENAVDPAGAKVLLPVAPTGAAGLGYVVPAMLWLASAATTGTTVGGYGYTWNKANNSVQILASSGTQTAGTGTVSQEMTNGTAIPAAVSGDTIRFEAVFIRSWN